MSSQLEGIFMQHTGLLVPIGLPIAVNGNQISGKNLSVGEWKSQLMKNMKDDSSIGPKTQREYQLISDPSALKEIIEEE